MNHAKMFQPPNRSCGEPPTPPTLKVKKRDFHGDHTCGEPPTPPTLKVKKRDFHGKTPFLTVDIIIELLDIPGHPILLIDRKNPPHGWALPGGFVDVGESVEDAARREALEETGVSITLKRLLGIYSDPERDPRMHTVSAVYIATGHGTPQAGDDAGRVRVIHLKEITAEVSSELAFDHAGIISDYRELRSRKRTREDKGA